VCCWLWTLCHTTQHGAVLIIFPLNLQTITITRMLSSGGLGRLTFMGQGRHTLRSISDFTHYLLTYWVIMRVHSVISWRLCINLETGATKHPTEILSTRSVVTEHSRVPLSTSTTRSTKPGYEHISTTWRTALRTRSGHRGWELYTAPIYR